MTEARIEAYVDAAAVAIGLPLAAEHRPGVIRYFTIAEGMAQLVMGLPLAVTDDPAEAYLPDDAPRHAPGPAGDTAHG